MTSIAIGTVGVVAAPSDETMRILLENKPTQDFEESFPGFMRSWNILNGDYRVDIDLARAYTLDLYNRSDHVVGVAWHHIQSQQNLGDLAKLLKTISCPCFFIHGDKDPLISVDAGIATSKGGASGKNEYYSWYGSYAV